MKKISFLILSILIIFSSCQKDKTKNISGISNGRKSTSSYGSTAKNGRDPSNVNNPYDVAGFNHNVILDALKNYIVNNSGVTHGQMYDYIKSWSASHGDTINIDSTAFVSGYINSDNAIQDYIDDLDVIIGHIPTYASYASYKADIVSLEATVISDGSLSTAQKKSILGTTSVARYSADYWWDYTPAPSSTENKKDVVNADKAEYSKWSGSYDPLTHVGGASLAAGASAARALQDFIDWWNS